MTSQTDGPRTHPYTVGEGLAGKAAPGPRTPGSGLPAPLRQRHLTMIGLGGAIGSGLFVGSGAGIAVAGPGILISFVLAGLLSVLVMRMMGVSFGGMEVVTFAAAESADPARGLSRAMRSVIWRLLLFYIGSVTVIVTVLPWNDSRIGQSPFVAVLDRVGVPGAVQLMNVVLLAALLSALNANLYAASRMIHSLAERREAPGVLRRISPNGVPRLAVLASVAFGFVSVLLNFEWPDSIFLWMLNSVGAIALVVWIAVAATQLRLRAELERTAPERLTVRVWGYPALTVLALLAMGTVLVLLAANKGTRPQVVGTGILTTAILAIGVLRQRCRPASRAD
ncbi:amino acid permease [Streptomyces sp. NPDC047082]|uniref:amino acid permease n=1 Tax=Streptomyces sp. NPDC047082 TaxID=3155259 RepID=UPI003411CEEB